MNNEAFVRVLKETERQLLEISGIISIAAYDEGLLSIANARAISTIHGLRNIYGSLEAHPITIGELEERRFNSANQINQQEKSNEAFPARTSS